MARILLGVSGSIAAYKAAQFIRMATTAGHAVRVVLTDGGAQFVGGDTFAALTGAPVLRGVFDDDPWGGAYPGDERGASHRPIGHLALAERADLLLIAPASANVIARLAHGFADDLLTTAALVAESLIVAPAMNDRMWAHPATQANVALLRERGAIIAEPGEGRLASRGESGKGRLAEPQALLALVEATLAARSGADTRSGEIPDGDLAGRKVVVSAGGTREAIDAVRFIGNRSSGQMGVSLAEAAAARGAQVTLLAANVALATSPAIARVDVTSAAELEQASQAAFVTSDLFIAAAAVADFRPSEVADGKLKKQAGEQQRTLTLVRTPDVIAGLAQLRRPGQVLVGFAAEHGDGALEYGRDKLTRKGLDAIVVNDVSQPGIGFDAPENEVVIVLADREVPLPRGTKRAIADAILTELAPLLER
ncbi:MAG: bifunctional phosphopantothenoylcysteine decarboxylase/phosphopantothenate--cysteine ligase CoaBC [Patulibacter sp.]